MGRLKRLWICLAVGIAIGAAIYVNRVKRKPDPTSEPGEQMPLATPVRWVEFRADSSRVRDFKISLPRSWTLERGPIGNWGVIFYGPEEDGFKPNVHLYWGTKKQSVEKTIRRTRMKYTAPPRDIHLLVDKPANVAGMRGQHFVFPLEDKTGLYSTFVWVFGDPRRGHGEMKGVCRSRDTFRYRALFEEAARRLRWDPE